MAITITSQMTDVALDPGTPNSLGTGNATATETVIQLQGSNAGACGHAGSVGPTSPTAISQFRGAYDAVTGFTRTDMYVHLWIRDLYPVRAKNLGGCSVYLANGTTAEALYYVTGIDEGYAGGWYHAVLYCDPTNRPAASLGTAPSANIDRVGYCGNISATKGESFLQNMYIDAIRRHTSGQGITMYGGTSGARETFAGCASADTASYGLFRNVAGAFFIEGCITWGAATQTTYIKESLQTISFTNFTVRNGTGGGTVVPAVGSDYYRVTLADGTTGVTNIDFTDVTFKGASRAIPFRFTSNLGTGDAYTSLRTTYVFGETITLNAQCTSTSDSFVECQTIVPGGITLTDPSFSTCDAVTLTATNDAISGGSTVSHNTPAGTAFITTNDLAKISNHAFDQTGELGGHAIEITTPGTYSFVGNTFTGYDVDGSNGAAIYNNSGGAVTINVSGGGSTPTIRNGAGASTTVNNTVTVQVKAVDTSGSAIQDARVHLKAAAGGPLPAAETVTSITRSGSTATVTHTAHGLATGMDVIIVGANEAEYNGIFQVTVTGANAYTYTVSGTPATPATGTITSTALLLKGLTNASGIVSDAGFNYQSDQPVTGWVRKTDSEVLQQEYNESNGNANQAFAFTGYQQGQSFAGFTGDMTRAGFYVGRIGSPGGYFRFALYAHSGTFGTSSIPTGPRLAETHWVESARVPESLTWFELSFKAPYTLASGTNYVLVMEVDTAGDILNTLYVRKDSTAPTAAGNRSYLSGGTWLAVSSDDLMYRVYQDATAYVTSILSGTVTSGGFSATQTMVSDE